MARRRPERATRGAIAFSVLILGFVQQGCQTKSNGEVMSNPSIATQEVRHPGSITVIDFGTGTRDVKPASEFPPAIQFKSRMVVVDGKSKSIRVPIVEIRLRPLDQDGKSVRRELATTISIQYVDAEGNVLESTTSTK